MYYQKIVACVKNKTYWSLKLLLDCAWLELGNIIKPAETKAEEARMKAAIRLTKGQQAVFNAQDVTETE